MGLSAIILSACLAGAGTSNTIVVNNGVRHVARGDIVIGENPDGTLGFSIGGPDPGTGWVFDVGEPDGFSFALSQVSASEPVEIAVAGQGVQTADVVLWFPGSSSKSLSNQDLAALGITAENMDSLAISDGIQAIFRGSFESLP